IVTRSWPRNTTLPARTVAGGLSSCAIANSSVDLPQADSPTRPTNSPSCTSRSTPSTAATAPRVVTYSTWRSRTSSTGAAGTRPPPSPRPPDRPQGRVADLVEGVVEQGERDAEQGDAEAGGERPLRQAGLQCLLALRPVEHGAPADRVGVAEAEELQPGRGQHRVERGAEEVRDDERGHRRQHLSEDHVRRALAADL